MIGDFNVDMMFMGWQLILCEISRMISKRSSLILTIKISSKIGDDSSFLSFNFTIYEEISIVIKYHQFREVNCAI